MPCYKCGDLLGFYNYPRTIEFQHKGGYAEWTVCKDCLTTITYLLAWLIKEEVIWDIRCY